MKVAYVTFGAIFAFTINLSFASETEASSNAQTTNPLSLAQRTAIIRRPSTSNDEVEVSVSYSHSFDEYNADMDKSTLVIDNPLPGSRRPSKKFMRKSRKLNEPRTTSDISVAARVFPLAVEKPLPDDESIDYSGGMNGSDSDEESDEVELSDLINMIPDRFTVTETGGTYEINQDDAFMTSSEAMKRRSALYHLLSEIYQLFDSFDFDGFRDFLREGKLALEHRELRYHVVENLVQRSLKVTNEGTLLSLSRFIEMIDAVSVRRTVGKEERSIFWEFEKRVKDGKKKQLSDVITSALINYFSNEKKRIDPLRETLTAGDYNTAKGILESSNHLVFISFKDFMLLLERPCSSARFQFLTWAITRGYFNPQERFENELFTPLMLAAMCPRWSNDVVKAILWKAPDTQNLVSASDSTALQYAKNNVVLHRSFRRPLIEMLELPNPTYEALDAVLNKHIEK